MTKDTHTDKQARGATRRRISPALVLSVVALFAALSGAAVALPGSNTVGSNDIIDNKLKSVDLKDGEVRAADFGSIHVHSDSVTVPGGANENAGYNTETVEVNCGAGEQLISGSGSWSGEGADEELFLSEVVLNHGTATVTVRGGNDIGPDRTLSAIAHCLA